MKTLLSFVILLFALTAFADNTIVQISVDGISTSDVPVKAKTDSLKDALNKGCLQVINTLIGPVKLERNSIPIHSKILSQTAKFVQFYKASDPFKRGDETVTTVNMKISVSSLRDLLAQEGLLYQSEGPATILPLLKVVEKKDNGQQFVWWTEEVSNPTQFLRDEEKSAIHQLDNVFRPKDFYVIDPLAGHYVQWIPPSFRNENPTSEQILWLGEFFKAQIVLTGELTLEQKNAGQIGLETRVTGFHTSNGRVVGEVSRNFAVASRDWEDGASQLIHKAFSEISRELATQILDESTKGTLGATQLLMTLRGNFNYQDLEEFKKQMLTKMGDIKTLRERRQEKGLTTFEVDYAGVLPNLVKSLQAGNFDGFKLSVQNTDNNEVVIRWSKAQ